MKRLSLTAAMLAASLGTACGNDGGDIDPTTEFTLNVTLVFEGSSSGHVEVDGELSDCTSGTCTYGIQADTGSTLTAVAATGAFVGWSGDCSGTAATAAVSGAVGATVACTATFADQAAGPSREGILIGNSYACQPVAGPPASFNCNVAAGGSYNINAPSPGLDSGLQDLNADCYGYLDVTDFSSEDHGVVTMETSRATVTGTFSGGYYSLTGAVAQPFEDIDAVDITTSGGTVTVDAPPAITLVDDPTLGLFVDTNGTFENMRLAAFGSDPQGNQFGVLCRIGVLVDDEAVVSHPSFIDALSQVSGGATPYTVYAGIANSEVITGWDEDPRLGEAVRWFQLDGNHLATMGELE